LRSYERNRDQVPELGRGVADRYGTIGQEAREFGASFRMRPKSTVAAGVPLLAAQS
jgi:hypothetical protein